MTEQDQNQSEEIKSHAPPPSKEIESGAGLSKKRRWTLTVAAAVLAASGLGLYLGRERLRERWTGKIPSANAAQAQGDVYYCPMHPISNRTNPTTARFAA